MEATQETHIDEQVERHTVPSFPSHPSTSHLYCKILCKCNHVDPNTPYCQSAYKWL